MLIPRDTNSALLPVDYRDFLLHERKGENDSLEGCLVLSHPMLSTNKQLQQTWSDKVTRGSDLLEVKVLGTHQNKQLKLMEVLASRIESRRR